MSFKTTQYCSNCDQPLEIEVKISGGKNEAEIEKLVHLRTEKITKLLVAFKIENKKLKKQLEDALRKPV